jgi:hypothetical protein
MSVEKVFLQGGGNEWDFVNRVLQKATNYFKGDLAKSRALKEQKAKEAQAKPAVKPSVVVKSVLHSKAKQTPHTSTPTVGATSTAVPRSAPAVRSQPTAPAKYADLPKPTAPVFNGAMKAIEATGDKQLIQEVIQGVDTNVPLPASVAKMVIKKMNDLGIPADVSNDIVLHVSDPIDDIPEAKEEEVAVGSSVLSPNPLAPFVCRVGTKEDIAVWITKHMTAKALNTYVEPFIGGGAIYLVKSRARREAINDWNYTIYNSWEDLKKYTPSEMLKEWGEDKLLRSYVRTVSEFSSDNPSESLNLKKWITDNMAVKNSKEAKNFASLDKATWESELNGNRIRYIPDADGVPVASKPKTLSYTDLKDNKKVVFGVEKATLLYKIHRALKNLIDKGRGNEVDVGLYVGGAKVKAVKEKTVLQKLKEEVLPKTTLQEWLKDDFEEVKNPDPEATEGEKMVLKAKSQISQFVYEKLRSCGGFSGSGVITSSAMIKHRNGTAKSPLKKVSISSTIGFLLDKEGGLHKYNERLKNTEIKNGHWYKLVKPYDSPNTFFMLDPPYQATGGYGNSQAFNFEAFVKSINGIKDPRGDGDNPKIKGDILVTINGGDKVLALFRKYARQSKITWYGLKVYVRQKAGKGGYRYEIFYGNYKFDDRAEDILGDNYLNEHPIEEKKGKAVDTGAIIINPDGTDEAWESAKKSRGLVGHFEARNAEDANVKKAEAIYNAEDAVPTNEIVETAPAPEPAPKVRKARVKKVKGSGYLGSNGAIVKSMIGGSYSPNNPHHLGSTFAYSPPSLLEGNGYQSVQW